MTAAKGKLREPGLGDRPTVLWIDDTPYAVDPLASKLTKPKKHSRRCADIAAAERFLAKKRQDGALVWMVVSTAAAPEPMPPARSLVDGWPLAVAAHSDDSGIHLRYLKPAPTHTPAPLSSPPPTSRKETSAMRFSNYIESEYLKAAEYGRDTRTVKIADVREIASPFQDEEGKTRLAMDLVDAESGEVLPPLLPNRTQLRSFIELFGNDATAAIGQIFRLGITDVRFQGKTVATFTIDRYVEPLRAVAGGGGGAGGGRGRSRRPITPPKDDLDDDTIPF